MLVLRRADDVSLRCAIPVVCLACMLHTVHPCFGAIMGIGRIYDINLLFKQSNRTVLPLGLWQKWLLLYRSDFLLLHLQAAQAICREAGEGVSRIPQPVLKVPSSDSLPTLLHCMLWGVWQQTM